MSISKEMRVKQTLVRKMKLKLNKNQFDNFPKSLES